MQPDGGANVRLDKIMKRFQQLCHRTNLVSQRRKAQLHAFPRIALGLAVQRLMLAVFLIDDHREQAGAGPAARDRMERRRRLADLFAGAAGELLPNRLDHLPLARHHLQRLGNILAHLHNAI